VVSDERNLVPMYTFIVPSPPRFLYVNAVLRDQRNPCLLFFHFCSCSFSSDHTLPLFRKALAIAQSYKQSALAGTDIPTIRHRTPSRTD
jgi:hypothetical protein